MANARKLRRLITGAATLLLLVGLASASWAQVPSWLQERQKEKATLEETDPAALARVAAATDRGVAMMGLGQLNVYTYNFGLISGRVFSTGSFQFPNTAGTNYRFIYTNSPAFGVAAGPWGNAQVFESMHTTHSLSQIDWEAIDGARGLLFSDPPATQSGYPIFAISDLANTWPSTGWPAPTGVIEVWVGGTTWDKWTIVGDRNSYAVYSDAYAARDNTGFSYPLGIEVKQRAVSYGGFNAIWFQSEFTNTGSYNLTGVFLGNICDLGGPSTNDAYGTMLYDRSRQLTWVRARDYDPVTTNNYSSSGYHRPHVGLMVVESPTGNFRKDGAGAFIGDPDNTLTRVSLMDYADAIRLADGEETLYGALSGEVALMSDKSEPIWKVTLNGGTPKYIQYQADFEAYYPAWDTGGSDPYWYLAAGPVDMPAGSSLDFSFAVIGGYTQNELLSVADKAIISYNKQYKGPSPPERPVDFQANGVKAGPHGREYDSRLHAYETYYTPSGDITLSWDMTGSVDTPDPLSGLNDFEGIRIFRSNDRGRSWGTRITDVSGQNVGWVPYRQWDLIDGVKGKDALSYVDLGKDTGLVAKFTDTDIWDGVEYWYAIAAYDQGEVDALGVPSLRSLQSIYGNDPSYPAMVSVIAGSQPPGYESGVPDIATAIRFSPDVPVSSDATVTVNVVDDTDIRTADYRVTAVFGATYGLGNYANYYGVTLENLTTGDTLYTGLLPEYASIGNDLLPPTEGFQLRVDTDWNYNTSASARKSYSFPSRIEPYSGYEMSFGDTRFMTPTIHSDDMDDLGNVYCPIDILWSATNTQIGYTYNRGGYTYRGLGTFPGTVWDVSDPASPRQLNVLWSVQTSRPAGDNDYKITYPASEGTYRSYLCIMNSDYTPTSTVYIAGTSYTGTPFDFLYETWLGVSSGYLDSVAADPTYTVGDYLDGLVSHYYYRRVLAPGLSLDFSTTAPSIDDDVVDMDDILVVPNPYYITAPWDQNVNRRKIQFTNVPENSTIDIYTLSGELVASLDHHGDATAAVGSKGYNSNRVGTVDWNLWTYEYTEAAYGLYIFVVKTDDGKTKVGKFAVIR